MTETVPSPSLAPHDEPADPARQGLVYGGMGQGPGFTPRMPGEITVPSIMAVKADTALQGPARPDVAAVLSEKLNTNAGGKTWWESTQGRLGTRLISRGLAGSLAYALASMAVERAMQHYTPEKSFDDQNHYANANRFWHKAIRGAAKLIDAVVGAKGSENNAIIFRDTRHFGRTVDGVQKMGRTLGHEYVDVVFNFAAASIGDSTARNIAGLIDPHKPVSWIRDGKIDFKKALIAQGKAAWKTISYFAGEDFIVGLPYIYLMKGQRAMMEKFSPGFKYVSDYGNSDAYKVDDAGRIIGNYYLENVVDYQLRFSNYNVLTLMFRETYNSVSDRITAWTKDGVAPKIGMPDSIGEAARNTGKFFKDFGRYLAHSTIKAYVMMTPTVPAFALFRVPQAKRGPFGAMAVHKDHGPIMMDAAHSNTGVERPLTPDFRSNMRSNDNLTDGEIFYKVNEENKFEPDLAGGGARPLKLHFWGAEKERIRGVPQSVANPFAVPLRDSEGELLSDLASKPMQSYDPYNSPDTKTFTGMLKFPFTYLGEQSNKWGTKLHNRLSDIFLGYRGSDFNPDLNISESEKDLQRATGQGVNAVLPYTAYFMVKTEFGQRDTPEMDRQIDTLQDGIAELDGKKLAAGMKGIAKEFLKPSKNTGAGSVFGRDNADTVGATPWSKRVGPAPETTHLERARAGVPLPPESWRDRNASAPEASTASPTLS